MRALTPRSNEFARDRADTGLFPTSDVVGTFAVGQSVRGTYGVSIEAPVGSFASGLASDASVAPRANAPALQRRMGR